MNCFIMKALTVNNDWYVFTIADIPTPIDDGLFILLGKSNSPKLRLDTIRRGDQESMLFEGDVINMNGDRWLVCYERGFYVINSSYIIKHLYQLDEYTFMGTCDNQKPIVPISFKMKHLFRYGDIVFRLNDIAGGYDNKVIVRACRNHISPEDIQQECCMTIDNVKVYLGDTIGDSTVELHGGRIALCSPSGIIDSNGGGNLDGCVSRPYR